jgi:hypothetical protein
MADKSGKREDKTRKSEDDLIVPKDAASASFVKGLIARGQAARPGKDGSLPRGATHEIVGETATGLPILRRRRFAQLQDIELHSLPIDFRTANLHVRRVKKGTPSTHPILGDELRALRWLQRDPEPRSPFVFTSELGAPFTTAGFARMLVEVPRDVGMVGAVALLVDRQRQPIQLFGLGVQSLCPKQHAKPSHQVRRRFRNSDPDRVLRHSSRVWCKCLRLRPITNVGCREWKGRIDPTQRLNPAGGRSCSTRLRRVTSCTSR